MNSCSSAYGFTVGGATLVFQSQQDIKPENAGGVPITTEFVLSPGKLWAILLKRKFAILFCVLLGFLLGAISNRIAIPQYESRALLDVDPNRSTNIGISQVVQSGFGYDSSDRLATEIRIMQSDSVMMEVVRSQDLYHKSPYKEIFGDRVYHGEPLTPSQREALVGAVRGGFRAQLEPSTNIVDILYSSPDPLLATELCNAVIDAYLQRDLQSKFQGTVRVSDWLSTQLGALKKEAENSQRQLARYQRDNNLVGVDTEGGGLVGQTLQTVNQQLAQAEADRIVKEARYRLAQTRNPELLVSVASTTTLSSLRSQQAELLVQAAQLQAKYGPTYPKVREVQKQLAAVQADIDAEMTNLNNRFQEEYNAAVKTEALMRNRLERTKQEAFRVDEASAEFNILKHGAESASALYDELQLRLKEAGVTAGLNSNTVNVVDRAAVPAHPVSPRKQRVLALYSAAGLLIGLLIAVGLESLDDTIRTSEDAEHLSGLTALAAIPTFGQTRSKDDKRVLIPQPVVPVSGKDHPYSSDLVSLTKPESVEAEAFRTLRSAILLSSVDHSSQLILITSGYAGEGKSTTASNLALSFARRDSRVLVVDADLRKGTLHHKFGLPNRKGLSTLLSRESGEDAYETPFEHLPNLRVLTRGPIAPNPGEILASNRMAEMLESWKTQYDHVILDSSPVLPVADTFSLAIHADLVIILLRAGSTRKKALLKTRDLLRRVNARIGGIVINGVDLKLENYYTYSKRYGYGYESYGAGYGIGDQDK